MTQQIGPHQRALIDALRSGTYKQGRGQLHHKDQGYCCLGVACVLAGAKMAGEMDNSGDTIFAIGEESETIYAPYAVQQYFGFNNREGMPNDFDKVRCLANLNDYGKHDFNMIADLLESKPEVYFKGTI
jgi:hypothetical protein